MMVATDKRSLVIGTDQAPEVRLPGLREQLRSTQIQAARLLVETANRSRHVLCGCATLEQLGARFGYGEEETRALHDVGRALIALPEIESMLRSGELTLAAAEALGRLTRVRELREELSPESPGSDERRRWWIEQAKHRSAKQLRRLVARKIAEARHNTPAITLTVAVSLDTEQDLDRARVIASRKARRALTRGETIGEAVRHYLDCFDPLLRGDDADGEDAGAKSCEPDTGFSPSRRRPPAAIQRIVRRRADDCCEYPGCPNGIFLEFAHVVPHARGGDRSAGNTLLLCRRHHFMFDSGMIVLVGFEAGTPRFDYGSLPSGTAVGGRTARHPSDVPRDRPVAVT